jgi:hypothetical protein
MTMRRFWTVFAFALCAAAGAAAPDDLATRAATMLRKALPGDTIVIVDPMTIAFGPAGKPSYRLSLDRIAHACTENPDDCDTVLAGFVDKASHIGDVKTVAVTPDRLRIVVRPADYVAVLQKTLQTRRPDAMLVAAPLAGDLVEACYLDLPTMLRPIEAKELAPLGLDVKAALALCEKNAAAALPPIPAPDPGPVTILAGDPYESSYLALHDAWAARAKAFDGHLLVAVPGAEIVLYMRDDGQASVDAMHKAVAAATRLSERPIAPTVFRWTPAGWDVAPGDI